MLTQQKKLKLITVTLYCIESLKTASSDTAALRDKKIYFQNLLAASTQNLKR